MIEMAVGKRESASVSDDKFESGVRGTPSRMLDIGWGNIDTRDAFDLRQVRKGDAQNPGAAAHIYNPLPDN
jgi:hypothetical protein